MTQGVGRAGAVALCYPVVVEVEYKLVVNGKPARTGRGRTLSLSSAIVMFSPEESLPPGNQIDLSIAWPALLNEKIKLRLCIKGIVVESHVNYVTVKILRYEFSH